MIVMVHKQIIHFAAGGLVHMIQSTPAEVQLISDK